MDVGVGLWSMRSTAEVPASFPKLYANLQEDARLVERLGFHSLWIAEHHFWYDGWCPSVIAAAASVLGATTRLRAGTGILLLALQDPAQASATIRTAMDLSGGRLDLGVGLGYRDVEFDGFGLTRKTRGRRTDAALDELIAGWAGDAQAPPVWIGGISAPAMARAGSRGLGILMPNTMRTDELHDAFALHRAAADEAKRPLGRVAVMRYAWPTDGSTAERDEAHALIRQSILEYYGAWFPLRGRPGFEVPELLDKQIARATASALVGSTEHIADGLAELEPLGVDLAVLQVPTDGTGADHRAAITELAASAAMVARPVAV
jgi:alkanesulfonate monooxygenase SsuD/methylene tetrahydromethanopterin reductase-like flavin-dependent oxidoreductase (luciferase family)